MILVREEPSYMDRVLVNILSLRYIYICFREHKAGRKNWDPICTLHAVLYWSLRVVYAFYFKNIKSN